MSQWPTTLSVLTRDPGKTARPLGQAGDHDSHGPLGRGPELEHCGHVYLPPGGGVYECRPGKGPDVEREVGVKPERMPRVQLVGECVPADGDGGLNPGVYAVHQDQQ